MQQKRDFLIFLFAVLLLFGGWYFLRPYILPDKPAPDPAAKVDGTRDDKDGKDGKEKKAGPGKLSRLPALPSPTPDGDLIHLGSTSHKSDYELAVVLDPLGGGVRSVLLNKFRAADADGRPLPEDQSLELVPDQIHQQEPAFLMFAFDEESSNDRPLDTLGRNRWEVVRKEGGKWLPVTDAARAVVEGVNDRNNATQEVSFRRTSHGVTLVKTYSLAEGEYHVGLRVEMSRPPAGPNDGKKELRPIKFRYQLAGARGLPVEGKWYTSIFRDAYICQVTSDNSAYRDKQDLRQISNWGSGNFVDRDTGKFIRFAGVGVQYFASVIVVDDQQEPGQDEKFLRRARPTLETAVVRGTLKSKGTDWLVITPGDGKSPDETIDLPASGPAREAAADLEVGKVVAVVAKTLSYSHERKECPRLALEVRTGNRAEATHWQWEDDITIRVNTDSMEINPGDTVTHKYLLYHGPVKPSLLRGLRGDSKVDHELITRYATTLQLNTMTDYPSQGFPSSIGYYTGFSWLVIYCTNIIHWLMRYLTMVVPSYGICILLLTILVRGLMFPLSRKQALMGVKMQALAPEIKKLGEKYKDDQQARGQAMMELYRKHGVNPLGSCWVMLLQMPVFMGLYYALQESIQFRLAAFWPTWIDNLAAPDMMINWTRNIPVISADASYGGFIYLGPYLNILPIIAVALMLVQQKMMTPPPADEQQEMQQKMMKWMMILMCLMFYKVAAGLCIYFIASSLWGFAERKMLPKAKKVEDSADDDTPDPVAADRQPSQQITTKPNGAVAAGKKPGRNKRKGGKGAATQAKEKEQPQSRLGQLRQRVSDRWNDVLESARKK